MRSTNQLISGTVAVTVAVMIFTLILIPALDDAHQYMDETVAFIADVIPTLLILAILMSLVYMITTRRRYRSHKHASKHHGRYYQYTMIFQTF